MHVGMGINFVYHRDGCYKRMDGIGVCTYNLLKNLNKLKEVKTTPVFFKKPYLINFCKNTTFHQEAHAFLNPFLPFNIHRSLEKKIDIFHATDFIVPKLTNTPVVSTIYDAVMFKDIGIVNPRFRKIKNYFLKKHAQYADHIITISHSVVDDIINYWDVDEKKISVVYPGISTDWFFQVPKERIKKILSNYHIDRPFLLSVGTIQGKKNYTRLLDAYMQIPQGLRKSITLVVVGKRGSSPLEEVKKIEKLHIEKHIKWLKYIPFEDLRALYQSALALIFPSLNEGFGLPILEGFASKIPVLTSEFGAMREIASNAAFFVNPYEINSIREGMRKLVSEPTLRADLVRKGLIRVKDFSWEGYAKKLSQIYRLLI